MKKIHSFLLLILLPLLVFAQTKGTIHFQILDSDTGQLIPARLTMLKEGKPFHHGVDSYLQLACRDNTIYTASGTGSFALAPGDYEFWFGRGMEYSVDIHQVTIGAGQNHYIKANLQRELDTKGLVCGDMHLHTLTNSGHGDASLEERVISCAAEGLEWAVATDHNFLTDYTPYLKAVGLFGKMATTISNEVSTQMGHYNTYPLTKDTEVADYTLMNGKELFEHLRSISDNPIVVQVNHPRWSGTDFFNINELHPYFGTIEGDKWDWDFDAIEVLNENYQLGWIEASDNKYSVKRDWFNMLNQNKRICGVGNSDSHTVTSSIAAVPRNYIASSTDEVSEIDEKELSENVKAGKVSVACGLLAGITANDVHGPGSTVTPAVEGVKLNLKVQAASWISCNRAELIRNGVVEASFEIPESTDAVRLDTTIVVNPEKDSWYLLIAYGDKPMYPMVGTLQKPIMPLGFTNPIWIDGNPDGKMTSIFEFTLQNLQGYEGAGVEEHMQWLAKEPEVIPYVFNHYFSSDPAFAVLLSKEYLEMADTDHQLMLFRELSKSNTPEAKKVLKSWRSNSHSPLMEIALEKYLLFPESDNPVQRFKKKEDAKVDEILTNLQKQYAYINSGAITSSMAIQFGTKSDGWHNLKMQKNGFFYPGKHPDATYSGIATVKTSLYARKDTFVTTYLKSNKDIVIIEEGGTKKTVNANAKTGFQKKLVSIAVKKGMNTLFFQIDDFKDAEFSFMEVSHDLLLDPSEEIIEVDHMAKDKKVAYLTPYNEKYHGFGIALTDGIRSSTNWHNQLWQGWTGQPMEVIIDLEKKQKIHQIAISTLADQGSWIFFPKKIQFFVSYNGTDYHQISEINVAAEKQLGEARLKEFKDSFLYLNARYIKVKATPIDVLPEWHNAAGNPGAWIFIDEIIVE
jgi:hypothetical protein